MNRTLLRQGYGGQVGRIGLMGLIALAFCSCAHVYHAPSNAKLEASTGRLSNAVVKASNTAERARGHVEAAEAAAKKEATAAESLSRQADDLIALLPPELKAKGAALKVAVAEDHAEVGEIVANVYAAQLDHVELKQELAEARSADVQVHLDKAEYYQNADKLAATATKQSTKLAWYRLHFWGSWIALGVGVLACIAFAFLKFTGRLTLAGAKAYLGVKP